MNRPLANILRPTRAQGDVGQLQGSPSIILRDVPLLKFTTLSVSEGEVAGQQQAVAVHSFEIHADPGKPLRHTDYLTLGPAHKRRLEIQQIIDDQQNGQKLTLICGEERQEQ